MTVFIADIASYQAGLNLSALTDCVAVEVKCTEGATYANPDYAGWVAQGHSDGLPLLAYHYVDGSAASAQATNLKSHISDSSLRVMFDAEKGSVDLPHTLAVVDASVAAGLSPRFLYLPRWFWQQIGSPDLSGPLGSRGLLLINAAYPSSNTGTAAALYPGDNAAGWEPYGGVTPTLYQFTSTALEGGQKVDVNAFRGTRDGFLTLLGGSSSRITDPAPSAPAWPGVDFIYKPGVRLVASTAVKTWQTQMRNRGWTITADGLYGPGSETVCRAFQQDSNAHGWPLTVDGVVGPKTWAATWERPVTR